MTPERQTRLTPAQQANVFQGGLEMALWGLGCGVTPTRAVEQEIADVIRAHPIALREFQTGPPDVAARIVRWACEEWQRLRGPLP